MAPVIWTDEWSPITPKPHVSNTRMTVDNIWRQAQLCICVDFFGLHGDLGLKFWQLPEKSTGCWFFCGWVPSFYRLHGEMCLGHQMVSPKDSYEEFDSASWNLLHFVCWGLQPFDFLLLKFNRINHLMKCFTYYSNVVGILLAFTMFDGS